MSQKLTDWFPADVKPVHKGVYELGWEDEDGRCFANWDGKKWGFAQWQFFHTSEETCQIAANMPGVFAIQTRWRGLAEEPK
ncbi:hypothetical protein [Pandoraea sputorum]|uniref:Uncharacterized protein n=1 Tax=Pandoraea sputorum TaxID=93222 RepID=A0A5E5BLD4_9BURK|nr:hypothetical protein [Pandoraea sputorum]VVE85150.1 hypothetical protein PSP31121_05104 [Pandoraea sputorum]